MKYLNIFLKTSLALLIMGFLFISSAHALVITPTSGKVNTTGGLNLRSCAGWSCSAIKVIPNGTSLTFSETSGDWFKTTYSGSTGWVHSNYTVLTGTPSTITSRGNTSKKMMSLTFDAGADYGFTTKILDTFKSNSIRTSFGLTGKWVNAYPDAARRIVSDGHHIINHTYNHPSFTGVSTGTTPLSPAKRLTEIQSAENSFKKVMNITTKPYFRNTYLDYDTGTQRDIGAYGFSKSILGRDSDGWTGITADQICNNVINRAGNGVIIIMHVGAASQDGNALSCIITRLRNLGYSLGTVPEVISTSTLTPFPTKTPTPTPTRVPSPTPTRTPTPTVTTSPTPSSTITPTLTPTATPTSFVVTAYPNPPTGLSTLTGYDSRRIIFKVLSNIRLTRVACYACGSETRFVLYNSSSTYTFGSQLLDVLSNGTTDSWTYANISIPLNANSFYAVRYDPSQSPSYFGTTQTDYTDVSFQKYSTYNSPSWKTGSFEIQLTYSK